MDRKKIGIIILIMVTAVLNLAACGRGNVYEGNKSGYTQVHNVTGVVFDMPSSLLSQATAISAISDNEEYDGMYVYKNDGTSYILFDMDQIVVACAETDFSFQGSVTEETLASQDIMGVWFERDGKKLTYEEYESDGLYKVILNVKAAYSLTPTEYNNFVGKLATVAYGSHEWSIFIGAASTDGTLTSSQEKIVNHIAKSLMVVVEDTEADTEENTEEITEESIPASSEEIEHDEPTTEEVEVDNPEPETELAESTEDSLPQESESENSTEEQYIIQAVDNAVNLLTDSKESSPYNPLSVGEWGRGMAQGSYGMDNIYAVRLDAVYSGKEAADIVSRYGDYYPEALAGTSFEVAEFTFAFNPTEKYMDIRFEGVDGEKLIQRGVSYSMRTYDILDEVTEVEEGVFTKVYVYYEVPNGCKEYMLEVGEQAKKEGIRNTACYLVKK